MSALDIHVPPLAPQREIDPEISQVSAAAVRGSPRVHLARRDPHQHGQRKDGQEETPQERQRRGTVSPAFFTTEEDDSTLIPSNLSPKW